MGRTACTEPQCLHKGALYLYLRVELCLYSPYGPYSLYRASVPVQGCTLPLPFLSIENTTGMSYLQNRSGNLQSRRRLVCPTAIPDRMENKQTTAHAGLQTQVSQSSNAWASLIMKLRIRICKENRLHLHYQKIYDTLTYKIQGVPLPTKPGSSLIIPKPMKILQRDLNRSTFVV